MNFIFIIMFWSYMAYIHNFIYYLIPILAQIAFSFLIEKRVSRKVIFTVFSTEGITIAISHLIYEIIKEYKYLDISNIKEFISLEFFRFDAFYIIIFFMILLVITSIICLNIHIKINYKKWFTLIIGYLINLSIILIICFNFKNIFE